MLIKCYREKLVVKSGLVIKIGDISKEEALQYLKLQKIYKEQAAQIYKLISGRIIYLKSIIDKIKRNGTLKGIYIAYYAENRVSFLPPLQLYAR